MVEKEKRFFAHFNPAKSLSEISPLFAYFSSN